MNCGRVSADYYEQLEKGIAEMETSIERLRTEIHELKKIKLHYINLMVFLKRNRKN